MKPFLRRRRVLPLASVALLVALLGLLSQPVGVVHAAFAIVTNCNDSGAGSLRDAINNAQAGDTITFSVSCDIKLMSPLTINTNNLTVDGSG